MNEQKKPIQEDQSRKRRIEHDNVPPAKRQKQESDNEKRQFRLYLVRKQILYKMKEKRLNACFDEFSKLSLS